MSPANDAADEPPRTDGADAMRATLIRRLWMRSRRLSGLARYMGAVLLAVLACGVRIEFNALWGSSHPYVFAFAVTLFTALFAGTGPALLGMVVMTLLTALWVLEPAGVLAVNTMSTAAGLLAFVLVDSAVAWLGGQHRHLLAEAEAQREALARQTTARSRAEERLQTALDAAGMVVWDWNVDTGAVERSPNAERVLGVPVVHVDQFLAALHPADRPRFEERVSAVLRGEARYELEYRLLRADGTARWLSDQATLTTSAATGHRHLAGVCMDVTARKEAQEGLRAARDEAQAANRAKDDFLAALSHELRTPLTPVLLCSAVLSEEPSLPAEIREDLAMIRRNVALEARLIDDLLDVTRIARGKLELQREAADAHLLLRQASEIVASDAVQNGVRLRWELRARETQLDADPARIQQVFWNLLHNAVKFTESGGSVTMRTSNPAPGRLRIDFVDTGRGIAPEALCRIFRPFDQGELEGAQHRFGGLGLGLAICKAIVEMHGGSLRVESAGLGHGATFSVELPATTATNTTAAPQGTNGHHDPAPPGLRLLLVEDHVPTLETLTRLLRRDGHAVQAARTKAEALQLATAHEFDLVLSDLGLPDGSGLELMRSIREQHGWPGVALTGFGAPEDVTSATASGFTVHLTKPVDLTRLRAALGEALVP